MGRPGLPEGCLGPLRAGRVGKVITRTDTTHAAIPCSGRTDELAKPGTGCTAGSRSVCCLAMTMAAQAACGGSGPRHWLKLHVPAQAAIAGSSLAHRSPVFAKIHPASPKSVTSDPRCSCSRWLKLHGNSAGFRCQPIQQGPAPATGLDETTGDSLAHRCSLELWCQLKFRLTAQSTKAGPSLRAPEEVKRAGTSRASLHLWQQHPLRLQPYALRLQATAKRHTRHNSSLRCYLKSTNTRRGAGCAGSGLNAKCPITHQRRIGDPANSTPCAPPPPDGPCRPTPRKLAGHCHRTSLARH